MVLIERVRTMLVPSSSSSSISTLLHPLHELQLDREKKKGEREREREIEPRVRRICSL